MNMALNALSVLFSGIGLGMALYSNSPEQALIAASVTMFALLIMVLSRSLQFSR